MRIETSAKDCSLWGPTTYSECEQIIYYYQCTGLLELNPVVLCHILQLPFIFLMNLINLKGWSMQLHISKENSQGINIHDIPVYLNLAANLKIHILCLLHWKVNSTVLLR